MGPRIAHGGTVQGPPDSSDEGKGRQVNDVVLGGLISLASSVTITYVVSRMALKHELDFRWDKDRLDIVTSSRLATRRARGKIHAWSRGELVAMPPRSRPEAVDEQMDDAYYELEKLALLFPEHQEAVSAVQEALVDLATLTRNSRPGDPAYAENAEEFKSTIDKNLNQIREEAQARLKISEMRTRPRTSAART